MGPWLPDHTREEDTDAILLTHVTYIIFNPAYYLLTHCTFSLQRIARGKQIDEPIFQRGQLDHTLYRIYTLCCVE